MAGASLAIGAATAVAAHSAKNAAATNANSAADADVAAQIAYNDQQAINAEAARNQEWNSQGIRQQQEADAATLALLDNAIRAKRARATALTSGADSGVEGVSVESVARQVFREQGRLDSATVKNLDMTIDALQDEKVQSESKRLGRTQFASIQKPTRQAGGSMLDLGLGIAGAGLDAYSLYKRKDDPPSGRK
jgi:hypothetical protein